MIVSVASHHRRRVVATLAALTNSDNITVSAPHRCNSTNDEVNYIISTDSWSGEPREIKQHSNIDRSNSIATVQHHFWNNLADDRTIDFPHHFTLLFITLITSVTLLLVRVRSSIIRTNSLSASAVVIIITSTQHHRSIRLVPSTTLSPVGHRTFISMIDNDATTVDLHSHKHPDYNDTNIIVIVRRIIDTGQIAVAEG